MENLITKKTSSTIFTENPLLDCHAKTSLLIDKSSEYNDLLYLTKSAALVIRQIEQNCKFRESTVSLDSSVLKAYLSRTRSIFFANIFDEIQILYASKSWLNLSSKIRAVFKNQSRFRALC
jgi:hypothetical protein